MNDCKSENIIGLNIYWVKVFTNKDSFVLVLMLNWLGFLQAGVDIYCSGFLPARVDV